MKIIDISWPITEAMTGYKDRKDVAFLKTKEFEKDGVRSSVLTIGSHTGTHVDAPAHFLQSGAFSENLRLEALCGPCKVIDMTAIEISIGKQDLESCGINLGDRVLFKTRNSFLPAEGPFFKEFIFLDASGAAFLAEKEVLSVGIDYLGVERNQPDHETHCFLLEKNIPIIEGLRLKEVESGEYTLYCLPLAVSGLEAAPARAILLQ